MAKPRILIVDDSATIVAMLRSQLEENSFDVISASDGEEGLKAVTQKNPDLVILDVMIPKIDGFSLCRLIKSNEKINEIPVLLLTGRASEDDIKLGKEVGANDFIIKPYNKESLIKKIKELLKKTP